MTARNGVLALAGLGAGFLALNRLKHPSFDLHNKTVLITGGSRGLGLQLAREFSACGARVAICARDEAELQRAVKDFGGRAVQLHTTVCDVTDRAQVESMVDRVSGALGPIDVLVNNAGVIQVGPFAAMTIEDFEQAMNVMFWGAVFTTFAVLPAMRQRKRGRIVNITSIGGKTSVPIFFHTVVPSSPSPLSPKGCEPS